MSVDDGLMAALSRHFIYRETVASVSMTHDGSCGCDVCRAALGDEEAFARVVDSAEELRSRRAWSAE